MAEHSAENGAPEIIAAALAAHRDTYEIDGELPTEYHGYAHAVLDALAAHGWRVIPPEKDNADG